LRQRRYWATAFVLGVACWASFGKLAVADEYPSKPIRLVVPFPVGGSSDNMGRMLADRLAPILKQPVVVENKAGAGGMIGTDSVAKSPADGYSLVLVDVYHTTTPVYTRKMPYDAVKDFTPVSLIARSPLFLFSSLAFDPKTAPEVFAFARANPNKMTMAIAGTGSIVVDLLRARSGLQFNIIPYKGAAPAMQDLMAGAVNVSMLSMASAGTQVRAGRLRALAVTGNKPLD
jgi:tripartite-type tricarboxylate transporter receptor subunit TctC